MDNWLEKQKRYQETVYGVDYAKMWRTDGAVNYVSVMLTAAQLEVAEAFQEVPWKPWAQLTVEQRAEIMRERSTKVAGELVDVLFFVSNALVALGCTDEKLAEMYAAKMGVNKQRQVDGYDGVSTKCANCGRALDEPGSAPPIWRNDLQYCGFICSVEDQGPVPEMEA